MVDFASASRVEMQGWPAVEGLLSELLGTAEPVGPLGPWLECRSGGGRWLSGRKAQLPVGEWRPAGARAVCSCCGWAGWAGRCVLASSRQGCRNVGN